MKYKILQKNKINTIEWLGGDFYNRQRERKENNSLLFERANRLYCTQLYNRFAH